MATLQGQGQTVPPGGRYELNWANRSHELMAVTPAAATYWLEYHNWKHRPQRRRVIERYKQEMRAGLWELTGSIEFDRDGLLINGQHRLMAIKESGTTQKMYVVCGVEPRAALVQDTGSARSGVDAIRAADRGTALDEGPLDAKTVHAIYNYLCGGRPTRHQLVDAVDRFQPEVNWVLARIARRVPGVTTAVPVAVFVRALFHYTSESERERLSMALNVFVDGFATAPDQRPLIVLRNWLINGRLAMRWRANRELEIDRKTARALQAYMAGESLAKLYQPDVDPFPLPAWATANEPAAVGAAQGLMPRTEARI